MDNSFNYKKTFYRRPIYTRDNVRLWTILSVVAITVILFVSGSLDWVRHFPEQVLQKKIKREYVAFLLSQKFPGERQKLEERVSAEKNLLTDTPIENTVQKVPRTHRPRKSATGKRPSATTNRNILKYVIRPEESSVEAITAAVENTPGVAAFGGVIFRNERPLSLASAEEVTQRAETPINIPPPTFQKFARHNGKRDLYETTAVMELNEHDIRYCFEKYARYDPSFSGDVVVSFTIHPRGYVIPSSIKIIKSSIHDPRILQCIKRSIQRWRNFPRIALTDGNFTVTRKYVF
jgi:hypothetical protein